VRNSLKNSGREYENFLRINVACVVKLVKKKEGLYKYITYIMINNHVVMRILPGNSSFCAIVAI
jgi:SPX domain protein involved in polyphosphate accumulation